MRTRGPSPRDAMLNRQTLTYALLFAIVFCATLAASLPVDLFASRFVFQRITEATGVTVTAESVRLGLPFSIVLRNISLSSPTRKNLLPDRIPEMRVTPSFAALKGKKAGAVDVRFAQGTISVLSDGSSVKFAGKDLDASTVTALLGASNWSLRGRTEFSGEYASGDASSNAGNLELSLKDATLSKAKIMGLDLPDLLISSFDGKARLEKGRFQIERARSTGGNIQLDISGGIGINQPFTQSAVAITTKVTTTPAFESAFGPIGPLVTKAKKPDGTITIATEGPLSAVTNSFR